MILQAAPQVGELNGRDRARDAPILFRVKLLFAGIDQHAVAVGEILIVGGFVRLAAVVEGDRIDPDVLDAVALFLSVVSPVDAVPVEIDFDAVFETGPGHDAGVSGRGVNHDRAARRAPAVVYPMIAATRPFTRRPFDVVSTRPRIPDVYRAVQIFGVMASDEDGEVAARPRVRVDVFGQPANGVER